MSASDKESIQRIVDQISLDEITHITRYGVHFDYDEIILANQYYDSEVRRLGVGIFSFNGLTITQDTKVANDITKLHIMKLVGYKTTEFKLLWCEFSYDGLYDYYVYQKRGSRTLTVIFKENDKVIHDVPEHVDEFLLLLDKNIERGDYLLHV